MTLYPLKNMIHVFDSILDAVRIPFEKENGCRNEIHLRIEMGNDSITKHQKIK